MKIDWQVHTIESGRQEIDVLVVVLTTAEPDAHFTFATLVAKMREVGLMCVGIKNQPLLMFEDEQFVRLDDTSFLSLMQQGSSVRTIVLSPVLHFSVLEPWDGYEELIYLYNNI
jgi:hypothetical protein